MSEVPGKRPEGVTKLWRRRGAVSGIFEGAGKDGVGKIEIPGGENHCYEVLLPGICDFEFI